jgi:ribonuclease P protein component
VLERRNRLTTSTGFSSATRRGRRAGTRSLVLHLHDSASAAGGQPPRAAPQVGFVVGRAVGTAVRRNLVKRRLRSLTRDRLALLPPDAVLVVRALPASASTTYAGLAQDFDAALQRLGISSDIAPDIGADIDTGTVHGR